MSDIAEPRSRLADAQHALLAYHELDGESTFARLGDPVDSVHYFRAGDGAPVALLPGVASPAALFVPLMADLQDSFELFALDRPGRGLSDPYRHRRGDIRAFTTTVLDHFIDAIGKTEIALIGSSFGGFQALVYALERPSRVTRISLVGSPAGLSRSLPLPYRLLGVKGVNRIMFRLLQYDSVDEVRDLMERINVTDSRALTRPLLECLLYAARIPEQQRSLKSLFETTAGLRGATSEMYIRDEVDRIALPLQFVWGSEDYFYDPSLGRTVAASLEDAEFHELPGAGHTPWLEPDTDVVVLIRPFLS